MGLILGIVIYVAFNIWILHQLKTFRPYEYDTTFCRDVRANLGMFAYASDVEATRQRLNSKKSRFWGDCVTRELKEKLDKVAADRAKIRREKNKRSYVTHTPKEELKLIGMRSRSHLRDEDLRRLLKKWIQ